MEGSGDTFFAASLGDPGMAAGVSGGDDIGIGFLDVAGFSVEKLARHIGLHDVVDSGASAADHRFFEFNKLDSGDGLDELAGLAGDLLAVGEVAGVVVGDAFALEFGCLLEKIGEVLAEEEFGEVDDSLGELLGFGGAEKVAVLLHGASASGGVDDDGGVAGHGLDEFACELTGFVELPVVGVEGSAASLICGLDGVADAVKEALGTLVNSREEDLHGAPLEHIDLAFEFGFGQVGECDWLLRFGEIDFGVGAAEDFAEGFGHPVAGEEFGGGELGFEDEGVGGSGEERLLEEGCADLIAGDLEDLPVLNSARASGFAGSAAEALVEVGLGFIPGELAVDDASDEIDSAAR